MTYARVGIVFGNQTATDARWTAVFLANFHFASIGTNYLTAQLPPSPLQNFWSLAVEEQFYLVYPTLFLLVAGIRTRWALRARLFFCLPGSSLSFHSLSQWYRPPRVRPSPTSPPSLAPGNWLSALWSRCRLNGCSPSRSPSVPPSHGLDWPPSRMALSPSTAPPRIPGTSWMPSRSWARRWLSPAGPRTAVGR